MAEVVISGEIEVDLVLAGRHLVVVLIDAAQDGNVSLVADVEFQHEVVLDGLCLAATTNRSDIE